MKIKVVSDTASFKLLLNDWRVLFSTSQHAIFQSFEFNYYSWKYELGKDLHNRLCLVLLEDSEEIYAIFPLYVDSRYRLRFINDHHADFCDYISRKPIDFREIYNYLKSTVKFQSFSLMNLRRESKIYNDILCLHNLHSVVRLGAEYSMLNIDQGDFPYNVPHYRSHQKHRINKANRKYEQKESILFNQRDHPFPEKELLYLRDLMISSGSRQYNFFTDDRLKLIESLYSSGLVVLHFMKDQNRINACNIVVRSSSKEFMFWIDLFDDSKMINIASYIRFIESVSLSSSLTINFGRGRYFYKVSNFSPVFNQLYHIHIFNSKWGKLRFIIVNYISVLLRSMYRRVKK